MQVTGSVPVPKAAQAITSPQPSSQPAPTSTAGEPEGLAVTHWFDSGTDGEPYAATIRFTGRRVAIPGKPTTRDVFTKDESITGIIPGSGPVSITTWVYELEPGEWTVTAERIPPAAGAVRREPQGRHPSRATLPRAAWSWRRWTLVPGAFATVKTRWAPLVRLNPMPAVVHGSWPGLLTLGVVVGIILQVALLARADIGVGDVLLVDLLAGVSGLIASKLWYVALGRASWRQQIAEGLSVDGFLVAAPAVGVAALLALNVPIGVFLDASTPGLFFGVAIGRLGCFLTGCCAGRCTASRWGVWSSDRRIGARRIPTQLMESATGLLIAVATLPLALRPAPPVDGAVFVGAMAGYYLVRQYLLRLRALPRANSIAARLTAAAATLVLIGAIAVLMLVSA